MKSASIPSRTIIFFSWFSIAWVIFFLTLNFVEQIRSFIFFFNIIFFDKPLSASNSWFIRLILPDLFINTIESAQLSNMAFNFVFTWFNVFVFSFTTVSRFRVYFSSSILALSSWATLFFNFEISSLLSIAFLIFNIKLSLSQGFSIYLYISTKSRYFLINYKKPF